MKSRNLVILAIIAGVLVGYALYMSRQEEREFASAAAPTAVVSPGVTSTTLERIEITAPDPKESVVLTKKDNKWYTDAAKGHRAADPYVNAAITALEKELSGEVVSSNPENYAEYVVDEKSGIRVKAVGSGGATLADLVIGKDGPNMSTTYVRKASDKAVVNADAQLSNVFKRGEGWRDRQIFDFGTNDVVTGIQSEGTSATYTLVKNGEDWTVTAPEQRAAVQSKATGIATQLPTLRASAFVDAESSGGLKALGLDPPRQKIVITHEDRASSPAKVMTATLLMGDAVSTDTTADVRVKRADLPDVYTIPNYQAVAIVPPFSEVAVAPTPPPGETTGTVSSGGEGVTSDTVRVSGDGLTSGTATAVGATTGTVSAASATTGSADSGAGSVEAAKASPLPISTPAVATPAAAVSTTATATAVVTPKPTPVPSPTIAPAITPAVTATPIAAVSPSANPTAEKSSVDTKPSSAITSGIITEIGTTRASGAISTGSATAGVVQVTTSSSASAETTAAR